MFYLSSQLSQCQVPKLILWTTDGIFLFFQWSGDNIVFTSQIWLQMNLLPTIYHWIWKFQATPKDLQGPEWLMLDGESSDNGVSMTQEGRTAKIANPWNGDEETEGLEII